MREAIAHALVGLSSLQSDDYRERPVDRLGALALAQSRGNSALVPLGRDLIAYLDADGQRCRNLAITALREILMERGRRLNLTKETAMIVATQAINEAKSGSCRICKGRVDEYGIFSIPDPDKIPNGWSEGMGPIPMRPCPSCHGSGRHRFSDKERELLVGQLHKNATRAFEEAHDIIGSAIVETMQSYRHLRG